MIVISCSSRIRRRWATFTMGTVNKGSLYRGARSLLNILDCLIFYPGQHYRQEYTPKITSKITAHNPKSCGGAILGDAPSVADQNDLSGINSPRTSQAQSPRLTLSRDRLQSRRATPSSPASIRNGGTSMAQELDGIIREESRQREARRSIVSEISHFSVDSNEDNDIDREARFDSSGEPLKTPMIGEETFSTPQGHAFPTPVSTATGRRRSSAISYSNGHAASHDPRKSTHSRPTHIELPIKPYPAGEGLPLQSPPFSNGSNEHPLPFSPASSSVRGIKSPPASVAGTEKTF